MLEMIVRKRYEYKQVFLYNRPKFSNLMMFSQSIFFHFVFFEEYVRPLLTNKGNDHQCGFARAHTHTYIHMHVWSSFISRLHLV